MEAFLESPYMKEKKEATVKQMVADLHDEAKKAQNNPIQDDDDDYDSQTSWDAEDDRLCLQRFSMRDHDTELKERFIRALPTCILLTVGFDVSGWVDAKERCFCPCGDKMKKWRQLANCNFMDNDDHCGGNKQGFFTDPNALMDHLRTKKAVGSTYGLHGLVFEYLKRLYHNYWPESGLSHKGLYIKGDDNYRAAEKIEKRKNEM